MKDLTFSIIIDALAYNTYITAYNTNMAANECFLDSATLRENVVSLARNIGYVPRSRRSSRARVSFNVSGLVETSTLTLNAGIVCNGVGTNSNFIFQFQSQLQSLLQMVLLDLTILRFMRELI